MNKKFNEMINNLQAVDIKQNDKQVVAAIASTDSATQVNALNRKNTIDAKIGQALNVTEDMMPAFASITTSALKALGPVNGLTASVNSRQNVIESNEMSRDFTFGATINDENVSAAVAAFKYVDPTASMYFSVAVNTAILNKKQDPVAELFYPLYVIDPNKNGFTVTVDIPTILNTTKNDLSGRSVKQYHTSLFTVLNDADMWDSEANRLYPVVRDENADILYNPGRDGIVDKAVVDNGVEVVYAPVKIDTEFNVNSLTQTNESAAEGLTDYKDMLSPAAYVNKVLFELSGKDADDNDVVETYVNELPTMDAAWLPMDNNGDFYSLTLNYDSSALFVGGEMVTSAGTTTNIEDLKSLEAGHVVRVKYILKGDLNIEDTNGIVYGLGVKFDGLFDSNGVEITSGDEYDKVSGVFGTVNLVATLPEFYAQNDNMRHSAKQFSSRTRTYGYAVQRRLMCSETVAVNDDGKVANNESTIALYTYMSMSYAGLKELKAAPGIIKSMSPDSRTYGLMTDIFDRSVIDTTFDLNTVVDGIKSNERPEDIITALKLKVQNYVEQLGRESNYKQIFTLVNGDGAKPTAIIGTTPAIAKFLPSFEDENYKYVVEVTGVEKYLGDYLYISFGRPGVAPTTTPSVFEFGRTAWSPEAVIAGSRSGGDVYNEILHMPVFRHKSFLPIIGRVGVTGLDTVIGRLA